MAIVVSAKAGADGPGKQKESFNINLAIAH